MVNPNGAGPVEAGRGGRQTASGIVAALRRGSTVSLLVQHQRRGAKRVVRYLLDDSGEGKAVARAPLPPSVVDLALPEGGVFRLGVLSDTHRYSRPAAVPMSAIERLGPCDAYLHCGDFLDADLLQPLRERAPLYAIIGNVDPAELAGTTPTAVVLRIGPWRVGAIHSAGGHLAAWRRTAERFGERLDVLCFGHSHRPVAEQHDGRVYLNPGSAVDPRGLPACSVATMEFGAGIHVYLLKLPG